MIETKPTCEELAFQEQSLGTPTHTHSTRIALGLALGMGLPCHPVTPALPPAAP